MCGNIYVKGGPEHPFTDTQDARGYRSGLTTGVNALSTAPPTGAPQDSGYEMLPGNLCVFTMWPAMSGPRDFSNRTVNRRKPSI